MTDLRPSGALVGQAAPPRPNPDIIAGDEDEFEGLNDNVTKEVFAAYECRSAALAHAKPHPGDIAEAASLSAIPLPASDFPLTDALPLDLITSGKLSQLQLEGILHACTKHQTILPSGERCGFFIGDGAGVGKGRQIAGIILDSYVRGRRRHCWVSTSTDLYNDALRDFRDLGCQINVINNLQSLDKATNTPQEGVLFATYSTLTSTVKGKTRLQQLIQWLGGPSFDGCLIFDEAHKAKHFSSKENAGTKVATAVVEIQKALPLARVVYCSATGVSEVGNMAYMSRLNLWGPGSAFASFDDFVASLKKKGISFLEQLAMEMKFSGMYLARGLSFKSAEFAELECPLTPEQVSVYNAASELWTDLRSNLTTAISLTGSAKDVWKPFWSAQQRFFKLLCVSIKVPTVVKEAQEALAAGQCVVIGLQSTGEAVMDALKLQPGDTCGHISVTKETLLQFIENHFPTTREPTPGTYGLSPPQLPAIGVFDPNNVCPELYQQYLVHRQMILLQYQREMQQYNQQLQVLQRQGQQQQQQQTVMRVPEAESLKSSLIQRVKNLHLPPNFLDELIDKLGGPSNVAEMTGRKSRVVRDRKGRLVYELRAAPESQAMDSLNIKEQNAFMDAKKLVAIVSDAASTGISLHASAVKKNQRRRVHLTVELPWSADKAIQQLGRSHRSNQVTAPLYKLAFTDLGGEKRFAAAVARRLQSLGALTRGDRRAASGLDLAALNLDSPLGRIALKKMYDNFVQESPLLPDGVVLDKILEGLPDDEAAEFRTKTDANGFSSAVDLLDAHINLHRSLRRFVDTMGVGIGLPRGDGAAEEAATSSSSTTNKELGDVRRFLNRLLGAHVSQQRLLFSYFQQVLDSEIKAARKSGYVEGVSDLPGQAIQREREPKVIWVDPATGLKTVRHDLVVDRGISFEAACARLEHEHRGGTDKSGFYMSRRPMPTSGLHSVLLALQKPGGGGAFSIIRPNTGSSSFEMDVDELSQKYASCAKEKAMPLWVESYESSLSQCAHGARCQQGSGCYYGRRLTPVTVLSGSIVRIWDTLERVLQRHELELNKSDRMMRIVRVDLQEPLPLIGVRYPGKLLQEVVITLTTMKDSMLSGSLQQSVLPFTSSSGITPASRPGDAAAIRVEGVAPVDAKYLKKAFQAPRTILSMFAAKSKPALTASPPAATDANGRSMHSKGPVSGKRPAPDATPQNQKEHQHQLKQETDSELVVLVKYEDKDEESSMMETSSRIKRHASSNTSFMSFIDTPLPAKTIKAEEEPEIVALTENERSNANILPPVQPSCAGVRPSSANKEVASLIGMGFSKAQAEKALKVCGGSLERAANWLLGGG